MSNDLLEQNGTGPLPEHGTEGVELPRPESGPPPLPEGHQDATGPILEPSQQPGRPPASALQNEDRMGEVLRTAGLTQSAALPALRQSGSLRQVLENLGPDLVAAQCSAINRFNRIADRAEGEDNHVLELLATKAAALYQHKLIELVVGRTVNLNASIKSQRDLPKLEKLTPEKRAQLESLVTEMTGEVVDAEYSDADS